MNLKHISCPIIFLSPANDFHGRINDLPKAVKEISSAGMAGDLFAAPQPPGHGRVPDRRACCGSINI